MATVLDLAAADDRGSATSALFTARDLAMSVPVAVAGLSAERLGLAVVTWWYLAALVTLLGAAVVGRWLPATPVLCPLAYLSGR